MSTQRRATRIARFAVLAFPVSLIACAGAGYERPDPGRAHSACDRTDVKVEFISAGDAAAMARVEASAKRLNTLLASPDFGRRCNASGMNRTEGRSVEAVCSQMICAGPLSMRVALYHDEQMKTLAFEKRGAVFINTAKSRAGTPANLAHEFAHVLGYSHQSFWGFSREGSVPYVLGRLVKGVDETDRTPDDDDDVATEEEFSR